jgi:crossover junction endodeoxyribonuclease RuvC
MPKQGVVSMFNYGRSFGIIVGAVTMSGSPYTLVAPQTWKKVMMPDMDRSDKNAGRLRAMQLWPESAGLFKRKCDQHIAEAALIAEYGRRTLKGSECG